MTTLISGTFTAPPHSGSLSSNSNDCFHYPSISIMTSIVSPVERSRHYQNYVQPYHDGRLLPYLATSCVIHDRWTFFVLLQIASNPPSASSAEHSAIIVPTQILVDPNLCSCLFGRSKWACCMEMRYTEAYDRSSAGQWLVWGKSLAMQSHGAPTLLFRVTDWRGGDAYGPALQLKVSSFHLLSYISERAMTNLDSKGEQRMQIWLH